jgi:hypothetical protein
LYDAFAAGSEDEEDFAEWDDRSDGEEGGRNERYDDKHVVGDDEDEDEEDGHEKPLQGR